MKTYQLQTDKIIAALGDRKPTLLLHSCCGPCSTSVLEFLTRYFDVTVLFYNPNIQPESEYELRLLHQKRVLEHHCSVGLSVCEYDGESFTRAVRGLESEPEGGARCTACFRLRLQETAKIAAQGGFDFFTTTLTVSPHKDAVRINAIGAELEEKYGARFLPSDFKKREGYKRSIELSTEFELYRQDYCGCLFSKRD